MMLYCNFHLLSTGCCDWRERQRAKADGIPWVPPNVVSALSVSHMLNRSPNSPGWQSLVTTSCRPVTVRVQHRWPACLLGERREKRKVGCCLRFDVMRWDEIGQDVMWWENRLLFPLLQSLLCRLVKRVIHASPSSVTPALTWLAPSVWSSSSSPVCIVCHAKLLFN